MPKRNGRPRVGRPFPPAAVAAAIATAAEAHRRLTRLAREAARNETQRSAAQHITRTK
ncbi:magnesium transporter [Burkholderia pseudomallei]|uniref:magnesium transporter n=1 Tax=Burkholderia pseudomallei TaxID=28450 RepID=UPI0010531B36|nr:magnesium transporter [Burkholderia pseudomallei]QBL86135.1 magnesium transporter [Burkholderia pseudomallei]QBP50005.1 magnesium transporter [Burkholderia pseudomallei]QBP56686.1 magnesium transporter [Burkholderia pseudomallei]QBP63287.1 magnesium transporter [Burkholderia pseudomallei]